MNDPDGPVKVSSAWVWHSLASIREQWRSSSDQTSVPLSAEPAKAIRSPTAHVVAGVGAVMVTTGGAPTVIVLVARPRRPSGLVTRRRTVKTPGPARWRVGVALVESSYAPSSSRSHA